MKFIFIDIVLITVITLGYAVFFSESGMISLIGLIGPALVGLLVLNYTDRIRNNK